MILTDTSVVVDFSRSRDPKIRAIIISESAAICGVTRAEVLHGARDPGHRRGLLSLLAIFHQLPIPEVLWDALGDNFAQLRRNGVTVPLADVIIATVAIANDIELWTRDNQFRLIQGVLPQLRLFQEPP